MKPTGNFFERHKAAIFIVIGIIACILCMYMISLGVKTQAKRLENAVETAAADITIVEKERTDKLDGLFATAKANGKLDKEIIDSITASRKQIDTALEDGNVGGVTKEIANNVNVIVENYPEISYSEAYRNFMDATAISESKIAGNRTNYNAAVKEYNNFVDGALNGILLNIAGYETKELELLDFGKTYEDPKTYNWEE